MKNVSFQIIVRHKMHFPKISVNKCMFRNAFFIKHSRLYIYVWYLTSITINLNDLHLFIGQNKVFCFLSGRFLYRTRFMRVIGVGFTSKTSNAIFLGNSGSHAILKVLQAWWVVPCMVWCTLLLVLVPSINRDKEAQPGLFPLPTYQSGPERGEVFNSQPLHHMPLCHCPP